MYNTRAGGGGITILESPSSTLLRRGPQCAPIRPVAEKADGKRDGSDLEARYANFFEVGASETEFVLLFGQQYEDSAPLIHTRIITIPIYVRQFIKLLQDSIAKLGQGEEPGPRGGRA